jgi:uncharacterized cupin superfamily protein
MGLLAEPKKLRSAFILIMRRPISILCIGDGKNEEILTYAALRGILDQQHEEKVDDPNRSWKFASIGNHRENK